MARISAAPGQRRWTVVIPHRLTARAVQARADAEALQSALPPAPGAIRFRAQLTMFGLIGAVASGLYVYAEKHAAASVESEIAHAFQATQTANQQTSQLRAEWALLNNPDRLHPLAERYLSLQPTRAAQFVQVTDLHARLPNILYGPPAPEAADDDAALPAIATKRMLAMAAAPAEPEAAPAPEPSQPPATPVVSAPANAFRVLAHEGVMPDVVDGDDAASRQAPEADATGRMAEDSGKANQVARPARTASPALTAGHLTLRPAPVTAAFAPRLLAHADTRPRVAHPQTLLRPELVHMLMMPHQSDASPWYIRPKPAAEPAAPQHHIDYGRSDPPHFLSAPPAQVQARAASPQYAAAPRQAAEPARTQDWNAPSPYYHAPPPYMYRQPYWAYNNNPYGGRYLPPPMPMYPGYQ